MSADLLLKFRDTDTDFGVTRETLEKLAKELGMNETMTVHLAIRQLASKHLPAYERDDGPLSADDAQWVNDQASAALPKGKRLSRKSLL